MLDCKFWQDLFFRAEKYFTNSINPGDKSVIIDMCIDLKKDQIISIFKKVINERKDNVSFPCPSEIKKVKESLLSTNSKCFLCEDGIVCCLEKSKIKNDNDILDLKKYNREFYCECNKGYASKQNDIKQGIDNKLPTWNNLYLDKLLIRKRVLNENFANEKEINRYLKKYFKESFIVEDNQIEKKNYSAKKASFYLPKIILDKLT